MKRVLGLVLALSVSAAVHADFQTGVSAYRSGDFAVALLEFERLAQLGSAKAQHNLGVMFDLGEGGQRDAARAATWYRAAADQGYAPAQNNLGVLLQAGDGVSQDVREAAQWYRQAAEQGHAPAQYNLGVMYSAGEAVKRDATEARRWLTLAAEQGDAEAAERLQALAAPDRPPQAPPVAATADADPTRPQPGSRDAPTVLEAQQRLSALGYDPGPVDGLMGPKTRSAIEQFQRDSNLDVTGEVSRGLLDRLGVALTAAAASG